MGNLNTDAYTGMLLPTCASTKPQVKAVPRSMRKRFH